MVQMIIKRLRVSTPYCLVAVVFLALLLNGCTLSNFDRTGITDMLQNISRSFPGIMRFLIAFSYTMGVALIVIGFSKLKRYGEMRTAFSTQVHIGESLTYIVIGLVLFYLPAITRITVTTIWGSPSVVKYPDVSEEWADFVNPIVGLIRIIGYIAFIRGWLLLVRVGREGSQPGTIGKAIFHIVGGIFAINIVGTINVIQGTIT